MRVGGVELRRGGTRAALFAIVLLCHAVLILLAERRLIRIARPAEEPLLIFQVAASAPPPAAPRAPPAAARARARSVAPLSTAAPSTAAVPDSALGAPRSPLDIDWSAEAAIAAQHQTEWAAAPGPKSLDDHHGSKPLAGLHSAGPDEFGWDYNATHRVESSQGLPIIHLGDRCVVGFLLILPFFGCGFGGEIPVNGDLFKHLHDHDPNASSVPTPP